MFPGTEVELSFGDGDDDFAAHDLALEMSIGIIFAGAIVLVLRSGRMGRQFLEPHIIIVEQSILGVVNVNAGGDVHGIDQAKPFLYFAFPDKFLHGGGNVEVTTTLGDFEPKVLS